MAGIIPTEQTKKKGYRAQRRKSVTQGIKNKPVIKSRPKGISTFSDKSLAFKIRVRFNIVVLLRKRFLMERHSSRRF